MISYNSAAQFAQQIGQDIQGEDPDDFFGSDVAISDDGNTIIISAKSNDGGANNGGSVRVFTLENGLWEQKGFDIDGIITFDDFGQSVTCSEDGNRIAIAASGNDNDFSGAGEVKVFDWNGFFWDQVGEDINGDTFGANFGVDMEMTPNGNTLIVGGQYAENAALDAAGSVRVFDFDGNNWVQRGLNINGFFEFDVLGESVAITPDGITLVVGAPGNDDQGNGSGMTQIWDWDGSDWVQRGDNIYGEEANDRSGSSVDISSDGNTVVISSPSNNDAGSASGQVRVYEWLGSFWFNKGQDINPGSTGDRFGEQVKISSDGNVIAISSENFDFPLSNIGVVVFYRWDGSQWIEFGEPIYGEDEGDFSGEKIALTSDATGMIIASRTNDDGGNNAGEVRVYGLPSCSSVPNSVSINSCGEFELPSGNAIVNQSGTYLDTISSVLGCDSILEIELTIIPSASGSQAVTECEEYTWDVNGTTYDTSGSYTGILPAANGCDSIITLELTIIEVEQGATLNIESCEPYFWEETNQTYSETGTYTASYLNNDGCDSIVTLDLEVIDLDLSVSISPEGLEVEDAEEIQWLDCNNNFVQIAGADEAFFTPSTGGSYAAIISEGACSDTTLCYLFEPTGIGEIALYQIDVFPNPSSGQVFLKGQDIGRILDIQLFDISGKSISSFSFSPNQIQSEYIELSIEHKGFYLLSLRID
ncbi:MAG: T9SS type A sorting domain-containing protein, partial [Bacteroidota bacterium]